MVEQGLRGSEVIVEEGGDGGDVGRPEGDGREGVHGEEAG